MIYSIRASWQPSRENVSSRPLLMSIIFYNHLSWASFVLLQSCSAFFSFPVIRDPDLTQYFEVNTCQNKGLIITGHTCTTSASPLFTELRVPNVHSFQSCLGFSWFYTRDGQVVRRSTDAKQGHLRSILESPGRLKSCHGHGENQVWDFTDTPWSRYLKRGKHSPQRRLLLGLQPRSHESLVIRNQFS